MEMSIEYAIFSEIFMTPFSAIFFLIPLAEIIAPNNKLKMFIKLFIIRAIVLILGNFITPTMYIIEAYVLFFGASIVLPLSMFKSSKTSTKKVVKSMPKVTYTKSFRDLSASKLRTFGILDINQFKEDLYELFIAYENAYSNFNYNALKTICSNKHFHLVLNELSYLEKVKQKRIIENFRKNEVLIDDIFINGTTQTVSAVIDVTFNDYIIDEKGNFVKGNKYTLKARKFNVILNKNTKISELPSSCKNCGAPLDKFKTKCDYCGSPIYRKMNWEISSITRIVEGNETYQNNPIKMN